MALVPEVKPVISTVSAIPAAPDGEMDALLLGRTRVSAEYPKVLHSFPETIKTAMTIKNLFIEEKLNITITVLLSSSSFFYYPS